jgi:PAS domain S-box-containing protein
MAERLSARLLNEERDFQLHELFFSTTDSRGVIRHGNEVFARVSGMSLEELMGSPHSIIRHPDMPRAVFRLFWDMLRSGKTIAAYVKNLAADGRYYWVLAVAMPIDDGYLSVRMKPSSDLLPVVQRLYNQMLAVERNIEVEPKKRVAAMEASTELLHKQLLQHGFATYEEFMLHALATELSSRHAKLVAECSNRTRYDHRTSYLQESRAFDFLVPLLISCRMLDGELKVAFDQLEKFKEMNVKLSKNSASVLRSAESIRSLAMNAKIAANMMGNRHSTLLVVADSLGAVSHNSQAVITELASRMQAVIAVLNQLMFDVAATKLQCEVSIQFLEELLGGEVHEMDSKLEESLKTLFHQIVSRVTSVFDHLQSTEGRMLELQTQLERLERNNRTLRFVQFAGKKESSGETNGFGVVFQEVKSHIDATKRDCDSLSDSIQASLAQIRSLRMLKGKLTDSLATLGSLSAALV